MTDPRFVARLKTTSAACAVFAMLVGAVALLGWITGNEVLKGSFIHGITMKTNTALGLLLAGLALWLLIPDHRSPLRNRCGQALGLLVAAIGLVTMVEHVFGVDLGIDQALFREPAGSAATISPNRMGPPASTCFRCSASRSASSAARRCACATTSRSWSWWCCSRRSRSSGSSTRSASSTASPASPVSPCRLR